ncbi:hypothetical protein TEQG_08796 [Trichophyton equinum CBS 127.97]|uniref:Uncharacterized protein n=1 Tax=Trichophyton equinum (strain ATCC MYA-4606 / CBS 127.97) TaxID=559882 RepID=F2Q2K8_TRIEC|nr:hypothetical protein TEQG_08796 [Trichophyton equinum CBS 127.97]
MEPLIRLVPLRLLGGPLGPSVKSVPDWDLDKIARDYPETARDHLETNQGRIAYLLRYLEQSAPDRAKNLPRAAETNTNQLIGCIATNRVDSNKSTAPRALGESRLVDSLLEEVEGEIISPLIVQSRNRQGPTFSSASRRLDLDRTESLNGPKSSRISVLADYTTIGLARTRGPSPTDRTRNASDKLRGYDSNEPRAAETII